jgi:hypothetical protein
MVMMRENESQIQQSLTIYWDIRLIISHPAYVFRKHNVVVCTVFVDMDNACLQEVNVL